ncbi:MAG: hypothetical protein ACR2OU_07300 [Thermomicrobiales bacterium]
MSLPRHQHDRRGSSAAREHQRFRRPRRYQIDTSALLHRHFLPERYGFWRSPSEVDWAHDWEFVSRWIDEPWQASLQPTAHYTLETSHQDLAAVRTMHAVAEEERLANLARSGE